MKKLNFTTDELKIIRASIESRREIWLAQTNLTDDLDDILIRIESPYLTLKQLQKSRLIGCVRNFIIDPNIELYRLSHYKIFKDYKEYKTLMLEMDIGLSIINKLLLKKDKKHRLFKNTIEQIDLLFTVDKIYYSESYNGNIYKIGLVASNSLIYRTELDYDTIRRIKFEKINKDSFEKFGPLNEVLNEFDVFRNSIQLTQSQLKIRDMLMIISKAKTLYFDQTKC